MLENQIDIKKQEVNKFQETYLSEINGETFKNVPSEVLFDRYFSDLKDNYLRIVVGTDSGLLVNYINTHTTNKNTVHIFIEHPEVIEYVNTHFTYDSDKIKLLSFDDDIDSIIKKDFPVFYVTGEIFLSKALSVIDGLVDYEQKFKEVLENFNSFLAKRNFEITNNIFANTNIEDQVFLDNSLASLEKKITDIPALILGGGPTLDENIEWIKVNHSKFIVIAVGRITHRLAAEGIIPDAIATIDPTDLSFSNSKDMLAFSKQSLLVSSHHPNFKLAGQWQGKSIYIGKRLATPTAKNPPTIKPRGNTVSNFAAQFAMVIGCREIYLSGVDFCYLASGQSHEGKSLESQIGVGGDAGLQVQNYAGESVGTRPNFELAKQSFDFMIRDFKKAFDDLEVSVLSDKSAFMEHVKCTDTDKIDLSTNDDNNKAVFHEAVEASLITENKVLLESLIERKTEVQKLLKKLTKAQSYIQKKTAQLNSEWNDLNFINDYLHKIVLKVENILEPSLLDMIKNYGYHKLILSIKKGTQKVQGSDSLLQLDRISFLNLIDETIEGLQKEFKKSEKHLNIRISETKQSSDPAVLMEYWLENKLPGRIFIWENLFPELYEKLKTKHPEIVKKALNNYQEQFQSAQNVKKQLQKKSKNVHYYLDNINEYRRDNKIELLEGLKDQLEKNRDDSIAYRELYALIAANISYLQSDTMAALRSIDEIEKKGVIQFNALQLKLSISMSIQSHQTTMETFLSLCEYSSSYMPKYAEFLRFVGNNLAAIEIYKMYLAIVPKDSESIIKVYHLIEEFISKEEAKEFLIVKQQEQPEDIALSKLVETAEAK